MRDSPITESAAPSKKVSRMFGLSLHSWEDLMIFALAIVGAFGVVVGVATFAVVRLQRAEIASAKEEFDKYKIEAGEKVSAAETVGKMAQADIAKAHARMAEADARAKEAELKLEQLRRELGPRQFNRDLFIKEITGQPSTSVEVMYLQDDPECFGLAQQIWQALEGEKWPVTPPKPIPQSLVPTLPTSFGVGGQPSGVTVVANKVTQQEADAQQNAMLGKDWIRTPWTVLMHALAEALGKINGGAGGINPPPAGTLRVVVAPRI
jgi:hypothetical protein